MHLRTLGFRSQTSTPHVGFLFLPRWAKKNLSVALWSKVTFSGVRIKANFECLPQTPLSISPIKPCVAPD